jgi:hypothetical protein
VSENAPIVIVRDAKRVVNSSCDMMTVGLLVFWREVKDKPRAISRRQTGGPVSRRLCGSCGTADAFDARMGKGSA